MGKWAKFRSLSKLLLRSQITLDKSLDLCKMVIVILDLHVSWDRTNVSHLHVSFVNLKVLK